MCALYAFLRHTDDLADEPGPVDGQAAWRSTAGGSTSIARLWPASPTPGRACPRWPTRSRRHEIPTRYLDEVIDGVEMDLEPRPFETFDELHAYCYNVASAVGLSCIHIWGFRSNGGEAEALAESCGIALQLTNILRDAARGRPAGPRLPARAKISTASASSPTTSRRARRRPRRSATSWPFQGRRGPTSTTRGRPRSSAWSPPSAARCWRRSSASIGPCWTRSPGATTTSSRAACRCPPGGSWRSPPGP